MAIVADQAGALMETQARPSGSFYRPELDALRFFAFISVFLDHSIRPWIPKGRGHGSSVLWVASVLRDTGSFGLCLFFLLSAYLISELLLRERARTGTVHLRSFYLRRILRIWPLYFAMVSFGYLLPMVRSGAPWGTWRLVSYLLLVGNFYTARHGQADNPAGALWSISVEEQFYLVWPSITKRGAKWIGVASVILVIASFITIYWLVRSGASIALAVWTNTLVQFQFFGAGALIALWLRGRMPKLALPLRIAMLLGAIALWLAASTIFGNYTLDSLYPYTGIDAMCVYCILGDHPVADLPHSGHTKSTFGSDFATLNWPTLRF